MNGPCDCHPDPAKSPSFILAKLYPAPRYRFFTIRYPVRTSAESSRASVEYWVISCACAPTSHRSVRS